MKTQEKKCEPIINELDLEKLAEMVRDGYTSGRIDSDKKHIAWELKIEVWNE